MYTAESTSAVTPNAAASQYRLKVPSRTRNSLTNGARPGSERVAMAETRKVPASTGATFCTPP